MTKIHVQSKVLQKNDTIAEKNKALLHRHGIRCFNLIGSPGSGKTTLLERVFQQVGDVFRPAVVEGDVKTDRDMQRIAATGVPAVQIETGSSCHLNAQQVAEQLPNLPLAEIDIVVIENVGNLICPVAYALGEDRRIVVSSVVEGDDKPLKYPAAFVSAHALVVTKADLEPLVDADIDTLVSNARVINPTLEVIVTSARTGDGVPSLIDYLKSVS